MYYLSLCCIAKDEDPFLKEWIAYHSLLGVEHFFIYDNMSRRPIEDVLGGYADESRVTVRRVAGKGIQLSVYDDCLENFGPLSHWIGFLDIDELACPVRDDDLRVTLSEFEPYGGVGANWRLFLSDGHLGRPQGTMLGNYLRAEPGMDMRIKCFVQPARTRKAYLPHSFDHVPPYFCVNESHFPIARSSAFAFSKGELLRVNHYWLRSQQDWEEKMIRGRADAPGGQAANPRLETFHAYATMAGAEDTIALRFLPRLEKALNAPKLPPAACLPRGKPLQTIIKAATANFEAGRYEKALSCLCAAIPEFQGDPYLWLLRAMIARQSGRTESAEIFLRTSLTLAETDAVYKEMSVLFRHTGRTAEAEQVARIAEELASHR